ncbi:MAG: ABC transporter permease [Cyclobacteriaceae bacterium]
MKKIDTTPPRLFLRFFRWFCHPDLKKYIEGDLIELYDERVKIAGKKIADIKFIMDVLLLFRPAIVRPAKGYLHVNNASMFKSYFKIGFRNLLKYKMFSFINIWGLGMAMCVCMLLILMLAEEISYDQFHENKNRTYRILSKRLNSATANASSPFPLAASIKEDYPIIEASTHLVPGVGGDATCKEKNTELRGYFADSSFFNVFGFDLVMGNKFKALVSPNSIVLSMEKASLLFDDENPVGKTIEFTDRGLRIISMGLGNETDSKPVSWGSYTVTGVIDTKKFKSHLKFDALVSTASLENLYHQEKIANATNDWRWYSYCYTYVVLTPEKTDRELEASLNDLIKNHYGGFEDLKGFKLIPQKLLDITPGKFVGNPPSLHLPVEAYYVLGLLAMVIMISACMNYTNLSIARALTRAREIGVRKVNGAKRKNLVVQFLCESVIHVFLALLIAGLLLIVIIPSFRGLWVNQHLSFDLRANVYVYLAFLALAFVIALVAGIFPAFHLSGYSPVKILKKIHHEKQGKVGLRNVLSSSQFVISLFFIITTILLGRQFKHYLQFEYGFNSENIINIPLQGNDYELISAEFGKIAGVSKVSACEFLPATAMTSGIGVRKAANEDVISFEQSRVDANFIENLGLRIVAGKNLPEGINADRFALVNETGARQLGYAIPSDMVGRILDVYPYDKPVEVIGVMADFQFQTPVMADKITPLIYRNQPEHFSYLNVKVASSDYRETLTRLKQKWGAVDPVHPFRYQFFDDQLVRVNQWLGDLVSIIGFIAVLAIFIACLGLLGMAVYTTERRTREIAIRKVLGAANFGLALMLSRHFVKLLMISVLISAPLSYFLNNLWLQNFPNRVEFGLGTVGVGTGLLLVLGLFTIGSQTMKASSRSPVESLKME